MYMYTHTRVFTYADIVVVRIGHKVPQKLRVVSREVHSKLWLAFGVHEDASNMSRENVFLTVHVHVTHTVYKGKYMCIAH